MKTILLFLSGLIFTQLSWATSPSADRNRLKIERQEVMILQNGDLQAKYLVGPEGESRLLREIKELAQMENITYDHSTQASGNDKILLFTFKHGLLMEEPLKNLQSALP